MAHLIESIAYVGEKPWHGLGTVMHDNPTTQEALRLAGLDWRVNKEQLFYAQIAPNYSIPATGSYGLQRNTDGKHLGTVGNEYVPLQNVDAFAWFNPIIEKGLASIETAGSLQGGKKVWILAKLNSEALEVVKGDFVEKYILLSNTHDGSASVRVGFNPIRVVCNNTLNIAQSSENNSALIKIHHTISMGKKLDIAQQIITTANKQYDQSIEAYRHLAKKRITTQGLLDYFEEVFYPKGLPAIDSKRGQTIYNDKLNEFMTLASNGMGNSKFAPGTYWSAYNAVTEINSHYALKDADKRYTSLWFGNNAITNSRAFNEALKAA